MTPPVIEILGAARAYPTDGGAFHALRSVDLTVPRGELLAVVGSSGSGKSTLLNLIAGLDRPTSGSVRVAGAALAELGESALAAWRGRNVGIVFQAFHLLPTLTVLENVLLPVDFCGTYAPAAARARALALLAAVGIADQAHKLPAALSGGQQQRAAIARAFANDPPVIVADEPTGNLDSKTAAAVVELLAELARGGKTVVLVTHEREISRIADRTIVLADGAIVEDRRG